MKKIIPFAILLLGFHFAQSQIISEKRISKRSHLLLKNENSTFQLKSGLTNSSTKLNKVGDHQLISRLSETYDTTILNMVNEGMAEYSYTTNNWLYSNLNKVWNKGNSQFENDSRLDYLKNSKGLDTAIVNFVWNKTSNIWENYYKDDYTYNSNQQMLSDYYSEWDNATTKWTQVYKIELVYDSLKRLISNTYSEWSGSKYVPFDQLAYAYDANGNLLTDTYLTWNATISKFNFVDQYKNTYKNTNILDSSYFLTWYQPTRKWLKDGLNVYTHDGNKNMLTDVYAEWNTAINQWYEIEKTINTYDPKNNRVKSLNQIFHSKGNWENVQKTDYTYDTTINFTKLVLPYDTETNILFFKTKHLNAKEFSWINTNWIPKSNTSYNYYIDNIGLNNSLITPLFKVFPNPTHGVQSLQLCYPLQSINYSINIYDEVGQLVLTKLVLQHDLISIEGLAKGLYFVVLEDKLIPKACKKLIIN